jgi:hypothetical protein
VRLSDPFGRTTVLNAQAAAPGKYRVDLPLRHTGRHRVSVQVGGISKPHEFFHEAPEELDADILADRTVTDWLAKELVRPWPDADSMQTPGAVTAQPTRSIFIAIAAVLYLGILLSKYAYVFRNWRNRQSWFRS